MKFIILLVSILTIQVSFALPAAPVTHSHAGRVHSHPLPINGLLHRHGNGAAGQSLENRGGVTGTISSRVEYGAYNPKAEQTNSKRFGGIKPAPWQPPRQTKSWEDRFESQRYSRGDINCRPGERDCNVCANKVERQFHRAATGQLRWQSKPWRFNWPQRYPPYGLRPLDIFDGEPAYALGIPDTHVQGFVRTNSSRFPYAGSHSHKRRGGIFVIRQARDGKKNLASLHQTRSRHPSGVHALGQYLVYGEGGNLIFKNLNSPDQAEDISLPISQPNFGGGVGVARLSRGNHLVITTGPGGQKARPRRHQFYHLKSRNGQPQRLRFINDAPSNVPRNWPRGQAFSENLSVITECQTGDIYTIHSSGDEKGISALTGNGYWRLSRLEKGRRGKLRLEPVDAFSIRQNMHSCNVRAAGSVFVNRQHKLEFYCHGYAKDPDGSTFNILGSSSRNRDRFKFKVGTL